MRVVPSGDDRLRPWRAQIVDDWYLRKPVWLIAAQTGLSEVEVRRAVADMGLPERCPVTRDAIREPAGLHEHRGRDPGG